MRKKHRTKNENLSTNVCSTQERASEEQHEILSACTIHICIMHALLFKHGFQVEFCASTCSNSLYFIFLSATNIVLTTASTVFLHVNFSLWALFINDIAVAHQSNHIFLFYCFLHRKINSKSEELSSF